MVAPRKLEIEPTNLNYLGEKTKYLAEIIDFLAEIF